MPPMFEELAFVPTALGDLSLRRRRDLRLDAVVYEIKLGDAFLMSSHFTRSEDVLATAGLAALADGPAGGVADPTIVVGGLGLGYTAAAVLADPLVGRLVVVERLAPVIDWHRRGLLPMDLAADPRCTFFNADFFALAAGEEGLDPADPTGRVAAILVDIDHAPPDDPDSPGDVLLAPGHADFYRPDGLARLARHLIPGGVFGLWSNMAPDARVTARLAAAFAEAWAVPVTFDNPLQGGTVTQTVYLARSAG